MAVGPGYGYPAGGDGHLRASATDRERAIDVLKAAYAEGRLTKDEYDSRVGHAYAARTYADLAGLTADLPGGHRPVAAWQPSMTAAPAWQPVAVAPTRTNALAVASLICGIAQPFTAGLTMIPAIVLGHVARSQIRRTGESGDGLAAVGLALGWAGAALVMLIIVALVALTAGAQH